MKILCPQLKFKVFSPNTNDFKVNSLPIYGILIGNTTLNQIKYLFNGNEEVTPNFSVFTIGS